MKPAPAGFSDKWYEICIPFTRQSEKETTARRALLSPDLKQAFFKTALETVSTHYAKQIEKKKHLWANEALRQGHKTMHLFTP